MISVVLLSWKRPKNIPLILNQLFSSKLIDEIIIWNNNPFIKFKYKHPKLLIINSGKNFGTLARYAVALLTSNPNILIQDDDLMLTPNQIQELFKKYKKNKTKLYGCFGRNIQDGKYIKKDVDGDVDIVLGRVILFNKKHLFKLFRCIGNHGTHLEDDILFSFSVKNKHRIINVGKVKELPRPYALADRPDHLIRRQKMVDYCLNTFKIYD